VQESAAAPPEPGLGDYLAILLRRLPLIIAVTVGVTVAAGVVVLFQTKQYKATTGVVIETGTVDPTTGVISPPAAADTTQVIQTEIKVITGQRVLLLVQKQVGTTAPTATVAQVPNTSVVQISVADSSATDAVKVVNAYAAAYLNIRKQDQLTSLGAQITQVQNQLNTAQTLLAKINNEIASVPADQLAAAQARFGPQQAALEKEVETLSAQIDTFKIAEGTADGGVHLVGPTKTPTKPFAPSKTKTVGVGGVAGLIVGLGLGFLVEYLDGTVKDSRDLLRAIPSVPLLAVVPGPKGRRRKNKRAKRGDSERALFRDGAAEQAYETAAISIAAQEGDHPITSIVVASPEATAAPQAIGLAVAMTSLGRTVVLVDASPRANTLSEKLVDADRGLAGAVTGQSRVVQTPSNTRLFVVGAGQDPQSHLPPVPEVRQALSHIGQSAELTVLSADPILTYSDAMILASETSGTVLVARTRRTTRRSLEQALDRLTKVQADVIGVILDDG
jgi:capsular polysaccharide biosynthesis protein/Mrp family chromosome partitioning ATPase